MPKKNPQKTALICDQVNQDKTDPMTYGSLSQASLKVASCLIARGLKSGDRVAIVLPKGKEQIIAVLGVLAAGGTYVPVGVDQPETRQCKIWEASDVSYILTDSITKQRYPTLNPFSNIKALDLVDAMECNPLENPPEIAPDSLAYIIFTSGSTGTPKGVEITHQAAWNTISAINAKYQITPHDRAITISGLDFDLSVYDIFGMLSVGAALVVLEEESRKEASTWVKLVQKHKVSIWNSVPALLDMLLVRADLEDDLSSLRLVLSSGDWIGLDLPPRLKKQSKKSQFIALGGATEASIWSNFFEVGEINPQWNSIPYGKPLANQKYRIVNHIGKDCPDGIIGELWIGGRGIANGYAKDPDLSKHRFVDHQGIRWYRTGDLGRYWSDGNIEFLGRRDQQVKVRGYRIELGEIEAALRSHQDVAHCVADVLSVGNTQHLIAGVVAEDPSKSSRCHTSEQENIATQTRLEVEDRFKIQALMIRRFLFDLLQLTSIPDTGEGLDMSWYSREILHLSPEQAPIVEIWLKWLEEKEVIACDHEKIFQGPEFSCIGKIDASLLAEKIEEETPNKSEPSMLQAFSDQLNNSIEDYRRILSGRQSPLSLLDNQWLSPESLSAHDSGTIQGIEKIAKRINQSNGNTQKVLEIAILGGRTGLLAEKLLQSITHPSVRFTILEEASSMIDVLKNRLVSSSYPVDTVHFSNHQVTDSLRYRFDRVVALNSLHRYPDANQGLFISWMLLKPGGQFYALEHQSLSPIALITAAVLENAFIHLDQDRKEARSPMLSGNQWTRKLAKLGFEDPRYRSITDTLTVFIEAKCPPHRTQLDPKSVLESLTYQLPEHMIPERLLILPNLPLSSNGKVDRKLFSEQAQLLDIKILVGEYEPPRDGMELEIAKMWKDLLPIDEVGRNQVFFQIGGDSLLATRFLTQVKEQYQIDLSFRELFETPLKEVVTIIQRKQTELEAESMNMEVGEI